MTASVNSIIAKSLDALSMRYEAIAQNIANAGSVGYRPVRVEFEAELRRAADISTDAVRSLTIQPSTDSRFRPGNEFRLDLEVADASQTSMRYAALLDILGRRMAISRAALGTGGQ
jgi:flagellar basal-body rod protein FlgB